MELAYGGLHTAIGFAKDFSVVPMLCVSVVTMGFRAFQTSRWPRPLILLLTLVAIPLAIRGAQPFLRKWYHHQNLVAERIATLQHSCTKRKPGVEPIIGSCAQLELDLIQWPFTKALTESVDEAVDYVRGQFTFTAL